MRISDLSSDVCSSDLFARPLHFEVEAAGQGVLVEDLDRMGAQGIALGDAPVARDPALFRRLVFLGGGRGAVGGEDMRAVGVVLAAPEGGCFRQLQHFAHRSEEHTSELQSLMLNSYAVFGLKK